VSERNKLKRGRREKAEVTCRDKEAEVVKISGETDRWTEEGRTAGRE
jgi:hypothetical protein